MFAHVELNILRKEKYFLIENFRPRAADQSNKKNIFLFRMYGRVQPNILRKRKYFRIENVRPRKAEQSNKKKIFFI